MEELQMPLATPTADVVLAPSSDAPRLARGLVRRNLPDPLDRHLADDAALMVSELVTNAVRHAGGPCRVRVALLVAPPGVRVEVHDGDPRLPTPRQPTFANPHGRGLLIVDRLADRWGTLPDGEGKTVWFELSR